MVYRERRRHALKIRMDSTDRLQELPTQTLSSQTLSYDYMHE